MRTVFANSFREVKVNSTGRTRCNTPVAVGTKYTHVRDVRHKCSSEIHSMNKLTTDQKDELYQAHSESDGHLVFGCIPFEKISRLPCPLCFPSVLHSVPPSLTRTDVRLHEMQSNFNPLSANHKRLFARQGRAGGDDDESSDVQGKRTFQ